MSYLKNIDSEIDIRKKIAQQYRLNLDGIDGIRILQDLKNVRHNYGYFPIIIDEKKYGLSRDELYTKLKEFNILTRKYFYPLVSHADCYKSLDSALPASLPIAEQIATQVLCLPIYRDLQLDTVDIVSKLIQILPSYR
jgi:dTDP-4-amino-4,6-dideoxygalactose transaminase